MKNVKIKYRIFALSAGALIGMLIFSGYLLIEKRHVSSKMESQISLEMHVDGSGPEIHRAFRYGIRG